MPAAGSGEVQVPCAIPTNFRKTTHSAEGLTMIVNYAFDSWTGNVADLWRCRVGEYVTYGGPNPYPFPDPPFAGDQAQNPTEISDSAQTEETE